MVDRRDNAQCRRPRVAHASSMKRLRQRACVGDALACAMRGRRRSSRRCRSTRSRLPPGFAIEVVARVPNARAMTWGARGHAVRRLDRRRQGLRGDAAAGGSEGRGRGRRHRVGTCASRPASPFATARSTCRRSAASCASTTSSAGSPIRRRRSSSPTAFRPSGHHGRKFIAFGPDGKLYVPVGAPCNICEPDPDALRDHHADESRRQRPRGRSRAACATRSASTGIRGRGSCGSPTTAATCWATTSPPDALNHAPRAGPATSAFRIATAGRSPIPEFGRKHAVQRVRAAGAEARPARRGARACASTRARSFRPRTATRSSSPSTARGTAAGRSATASRW